MDLLTKDERVLDAYYTSVQMKKNRPGTLLSVLVEEKHVTAITKLLLQHTTTFGVRIYESHREILERSFQYIETPYGSLKVKLGYLGEDLVKVVPEYEDVKSIAQNNNLPFPPLYQEMIVLAQNRFKSKVKSDE
ncbi:uncharacterized protein (DUF111 family) [Streptococcus moroccensis]|uniref:Uncharacterized protein (DUF111 family) n=1 Tax=Streptococcus moroccensis TaxID=1451356 RepID=A0ABT9YRG2_9STRE|nr:uncharacterized protein (DUF111 family) [Streptococcus moroccensis]